MPLHFPHPVTALLLLGCFGVPANGLLRGGQSLPAAVAPDSECEDLAKMPRMQVASFQAWNSTAGDKLPVPSFSCHAAAAEVKSTEGSSMATCSPVCTEPLDVVVVLGASEWSLDDADVDHSRRSALDLLKHFDLSRARGSLFGFLDVSNGVAKPQKLSPLSQDRDALMKTLQAWKPLVGGNPVTSIEMQGFDQRPEVLAMLDVSRPSVRRMLMVLQPPANGRKAPVSHLGLAQSGTDPFKQDKEIMELLVSACPAVRIDGELKCGRMRWGSGEDSGMDEIKPFGHASK